jgi:orotidine-5'-phosphate decarboxylase
MVLNNRHAIFSLEGKGSMTGTASDKLIVALDVGSASDALKLFRQLRGFVSHFKIGSQLFTAAGPQIVREITGEGGRVFLDLKFHDIPQTVAAACVEAARLGVWMLNVHALGGALMMRRAAEALKEAAEREGLKRPRLIGVTVLTSADAATLAEVGIQSEPLALVLALARLVESCGLDGIVASPHEVEAVRAAVNREDFTLVTPGVRPRGSAADDQKRIMTPAEAVNAGADYLVIGRAILCAPDPIGAARKICDEMERAAHL